VNRLEHLALDEALGRVCELAKANFDESVETAIRLGVDPRHADQQVRGSIVLPNGTGKVPVIIVFAQGDAAASAEEAGADFVGGEELAEKIKEGWLGFDRAIAAPDMMRVVGPLGRILGPRGLMPNPKTGTVTPDVAKAVQEAKAGKVDYRVDRGGNVHAAIGKVSFGPDKLKENIMAFFEAIARAKPSGLKGRYVRRISISSTMGPGVTVDLQNLTEIFH
jgi:large subunit ribosomal protein L1